MTSTPCGSSCGQYAGLCHEPNSPIPEVMSPPKEPLTVAHTKVMPLRAVSSSLP
ncbi:hypothetical protein DPMN_085125 [Dreissena polymorpha]|uniref:Uncharacterized protein n=1 Tax=Dreissena polymorpha TaxID=45954 RepID=A0A9D3YFL4_DREPO|nr:hypothetical protein DPMN_085125 [Dreissena polymorpha]